MRVPIFCVVYIKYGVKITFFRVKILTIGIFDPEKGNGSRGGSVSVPLFSQCILYVNGTKKIGTFVLSSFLIYSLL